MADKRVSELTSTSSLASSDELILNQDAGGGVFNTKRITWANLKASFGSLGTAIASSMAVNGAAFTNGSEKLTVQGNAKVTGKIYSQSISVNGGSPLATSTWYTVLNAASLSTGITLCTIENNQNGHGMWCIVAKSGAGQAVIVQQASFVQPNTYNVLVRIDGSSNFQVTQSVNSSSIMTAYLTYTSAIN